MSLLVLSEADIRSVLSPAAAIESQRAAYVAAAEGRVSASGVISADGGAAEPDSLTFAHTAAITGVTGVTCKFGQQVTGNAARGLPSVHAVVTVLKPGTGEPLAVLNGAAVTALRTAAGIGAAADALARPDATRLGLIGAGVQAREAARMISSVRDLKAISVHDVVAERRERLADELAQELNVPVQAVVSAEQSVIESDIVVTATTSRSPVVRGAWLPGGATVLTIGSYEPDRRELDQDAVLRADIMVADDPVKAESYCGILIEARARGVQAGVASIGEIIAGRQQGRRGAGEIAMFLCTGLGVQDAALAWAVVELTAAERAAGRELGRSVAF
jgi:ornithine cyclodeaminase/alanine dehydrogenase-like protein (mu-crystallin family)